MLDIDTIRSHFPALNSNAIFLDNPGGTQIVQEAITGMQHYLQTQNANTGGAFSTSKATGTLVAEARMAMADFLNAACPEEIIFGQNMTSLTMHISRSLARLLHPGDEIVVTRLDHDANIAPWLLIAEDRGCQVRWIDFMADDCTLDMDDLKLTSRTKIVAVGYASNAAGTINNVQSVVQAAHSVGALCFIDAVQYAPHQPIDVQALDCDLLACSAYKFFGPHTGILYGKYELLDRLTAYKVRPASDKPPGKFETGTQSFESIAGILGSLHYLTWLGKSAGQEFATRYQEQFSGRRLALKQAMAAIADYELQLNHALLEGLSSVPGLRIWGIREPEHMHQRVPTFSFTLTGWHPRSIAAKLAQEMIYTWDGNYYALAMMEQLGLEKDGGMLRVGAVHYNTRSEIARLVEVLASLRKEIG